MARKRFSHSLHRDHRPVANPLLRDSLRDLAHFLQLKALKPLAWDDHHIAIALEVAVELPPLGNADGLDVRSCEPVLLVLSLAHYPTETPRVYPDRLNFPKDQLAHLYIAGRGRPPAFCLVRGDFTEWYANKRLPDVVIRTQNWLRDAAAGELTQNGQQFEPLRLEGYRGSIVYPYILLADKVQANASNSVSNFAIALFENTAPDGAVPAFKLDRLVTPENIDGIVEDFWRGLEATAAKTFRAKKYCAGYVVWPLDSTTTYSDYRVDLPQNWHELQAFGQSFGIDLAFLEQHLVLKDPNYLKEIPIVCALRRPQTLIGFASTLEFVNFYLTLEDADKDKETGCIATNPPVRFQVHNEPLTRQKAQRVSGFTAPLPSKIWVAGCGALGSKVVLHFARNGFTNFVLLDPDHLSPHNLVRHALLADSEGLNKALALEAAIREVYRHEEVDNLHARGFSAEGLLVPSSSTTNLEIKRLFDFTASEAFLHTVLTSPQLDQATVCRGLISDHGQLGILSVEGPTRNPRLDDLQAVLYAQYARQPAVAAWLMREAARAATDNPLVSVGVGCNSETTVLADDTISTHAAYFAEVLKHSMAIAVPPSYGQVFLSRLSSESGFPSISTERLEVEPLTVLVAVNDATWQVRVVSSVFQRIREELRLASPRNRWRIYRAGQFQNQDHSRGGPGIGPNGQPG